MTDIRACPRCGRELPDDAPRGLCPACLLGAALGAPADAPGRSDTAAPETIALCDRSQPAGGTVTQSGASGDTAADVDDAPLGSAIPASIRYFGDYEFSRELGRGGMGVVYKARQLSLNRPVAVKMIRAGVFADEAELRRFQNEAEAVAALNHPHIVPIYEVGEHEGQRYFSMKLIAGGSLADRLGPYRDDPAAAARLAAMAAGAVHHAHQRGVLHRDLKPANLLIDEDGQPHVSDFGLARRLDVDSGMTRTGAILGTPAYMAPEQASGRRGSVTTATDVYGLGAVLYALLTGHAPFECDSIADTLQEVRERTPEPPSRLNRRVPRDLEVICLKCLTKEPARRYPSAQALADDLGRFLRGEPIEARPTPAWERAWKWVRRRPAITALLAACLAAAAGLVALGVRDLRRSRDTLAVVTKERNEAEEARRFADRKAGDERAARKALRRALYDSQMNLVQAAWEQDNTPRAVELAEAQRPRPGEDDLRGFEWHYWDRLLHADLLTLRGHSGPVGILSVTYSPDGRKLVAHDGDFKTFRVWDADTGREVATYQPRPEGGRYNRPVAVSPGGDRTAAANQGDTVMIWDTDTGKEVGDLPTSPRRRIDGGGGPIAYTRDGLRLYALDANDVFDARAYRLKVWTCAANDTRPELSLVLDEPTGGRCDWRHVAVSPDAGRVVTSTLDGKVKVWDLVGKREVLSFSTSTPPRVTTEPLGVLCVALSPDGRQVALGHQTTITVWDAGTGKNLHVLRGYMGGTVCLMFSPDGKRLATAGDWTVRVWDIESGREEFRFKGHTGVVNEVAFRPDGNRLASAGADGTVKVWDLTSGRGPLVKNARPYRTISFTSPSHWFAFSPDGAEIASVDPGDRTDSGSADTIRILNVSDGSSRTAIPTPAGRMVLDLAYSPDSRKVAAVTCRRKQVNGGTRCGDGEVQTWDAASGRLIFGFPLTGTSEEIQVAAISPDARRVAVSSRAVPTLTGFQRQAWETATGRPLFQVRTKTDYDISSMAYSRDGRLLACGNQSAYFEVLDGVTGGLALAPEPSRLFTGNYARDSGLTFRPDGREVARTFPDHSVRLCDPETGRESVALWGHSGRVLCVTYSPDGGRIATGSYDQTIRLWDASSGEALLTLRGHAGAVIQVAFSPDGSRLASCSTDQTLRLWDARPLPDH